MKQLFCLLAILTALSCGRSVNIKFTPKKDTVDVLVKTDRDGPFLLKGAYFTTRVLLSEDSSTTNGKWLIDTVWMVRVGNDTLRDAQHHPLFDSLHHPIYNWSWQYADKKVIQIIEVPRK